MDVVSNISHTGRQATIKQNKNKADGCFPYGAFAANDPRWKHGYYFGDPTKINELLSVDKYHEAFPRIPLEELHASTVQHPLFRNYRWLLHTRRVPVLTRATEDVAESQAEPSLDAAAEHARLAYTTAGIGDPDQTCWLCRECRDALCHSTQINMPGPALANHMWGGREHPLYQGLSDAMRMLLGRGRPYYRKLILGHGDPTDKQAALVGNSILLAQPSTGDIQATLPPPADSIGDRMVVIFTTSRSDVQKAKQLFVSRGQYLQCARLRQAVCYAYDDVKVDEEMATMLLPENGVPEVFVQEACHMREARFFKPNLDGPASERSPEAKDPQMVDAEDEYKKTDSDEEDSDGELQRGTEESEEERLNKFLQEVENMSENLIGLDEAHTDDPLRQVLVLQKQIQMLQDEGNHLMRRQAKLHSETSEECKESLHVAVQGNLEQCKQHFLSIRQIAKDNLQKWHTEVDKVVAASGCENEKDRLAKRKEKEDPVFKQMLVGHQQGSPLRKYFISGCGEKWHSRSGTPENLSTSRKQRNIETKRVLASSRSHIITLSHFQCALSTRGCIYWY